MERNAMYTIEIYFRNSARATVIVEYVGHSFEHKAVSSV